MKKKITQLNIKHGSKPSTFQPFTLLVNTWLCIYWEIWRIRHSSPQEGKKCCVNNIWRMYIRTYKQFIGKGKWCNVMSVCVIIWVRHVSKFGQIVIVRPLIRYQALIAWQVKRNVCKWKQLPVSRATFPASPVDSVLTRNVHEGGLLEVSAWTISKVCNGYR